MACAAGFGVKDGRCVPCTLEHCAICSADADVCDECASKHWASPFLAPVACKPCSDPLCADCFENSEGDSQPDTATDWCYACGEAERRARMARGAGGWQQASGARGETAGRLHELPCLSRLAADAGYALDANEACVPSLPGCAQLEPCDGCSDDQRSCAVCAGERVGAAPSWGAQCGFRMPRQRQALKPALCSSPPRPADGYELTWPMVAASVVPRRNGGYGGYGGRAGGYGGAVTQAAGLASGKRTCQPVAIQPSPQQTRPLRLF